MSQTSLLFCAVALVVACAPSSDESATTDSTASRPAATPAAPVPTTSAWQVRPDGADPLRIGMTAAEARRVLSLAAAPASQGCSYLAGAPESALHAFVMLTNDTVVRIDVRDSVLATAEGARVGDTEGRLKQLYGDRVSVQPHKYLPNGHYLVVRAPGDAANRIVFETNGTVVTTYRAGRRPEVENVEGCG